VRRTLGFVACVAASACGFHISPTAVDAGDSDGATDGIADGPSTTCVDSWFDAAWSSRKKITIPDGKVTGSHTDFPVLIDVVVPAAQPTGNDLVFTRADGITRVSHEIERYEAATGRLIAWVKVPMLSSTGTPALYLYYGNATAANQQDRTAVWTADYSAVWHLRENPTGAAPQVFDSTSQAHHANARGLAAAAQTAGKIGGSINFDGANDGLDIANVVLGSSFSYEAWIHPTNNTNWHCIVNNSPAYNRWFGLYNEEIDFYTGGGYEYREPAALTTGAWHHVVLSYDGAQLAMFRDGVMQGAPEPMGLPAVTSNFQIGYTNTSIGEWFAGRIDEVRVSSVARSAAYIATAYTNQNDPSMFHVVDAPQTCP